MGSTSDSDDSNLPRNRPTYAQHRARLDEIAEAECQLDAELATLHQELGQDNEPQNRQWDRE
jgi:hypothetical protein